MAVDLATFHSTVSGIINRGTKFDTDIVVQTRNAARWLEQNFSFRYMRKLRFLVFFLGDLEVNLPAEVKSIEFLRIPLAGTTLIDPSQHYLTEGDPEDFLTQATGLPNHYFEQGDEDLDKLILDKKPDKDYEAELYANFYTEWPTDTTKAPWLVKNGEVVLQAQTMIFMAPIIRNLGLIQLYTAQRQENISVILLSEEEREISNSEHAMKMFVG